MGENRGTSTAFLATVPPAIHFDSGRMGIINAVHIPILPESLTFVQFVRAENEITR